MKLSSDTLTVLKNFAGISEGLFVPGGHSIRIKDSKNQILAEAKVTENLPSFCVKELAKFLSILTADKDVDVEFKGPDIVMTMLGGRSKINYRCSPRNLVNVPKDNDYTVTDAFAELDLTQADLANIQKMVSLLGLPNVAIENDGSKTQIRAFDPKNDSENTQTFDVSSKGDATNFQIIFEPSCLNLVDGDYAVSVGRSAVQFKHKTKDITYWFAPDLGSVFPE